MQRYTTRQSLSHARRLVEYAFTILDRFLSIEAASGIVLLVAVMVALVWANSPFAHSYHALWRVPLSIGVGAFVFSQPIHFWINDALMTIFFLVVGLEIRREIHEGALSNPRQASLPILAALGGVAVPALIYLGFNSPLARRYGWAVPTATDIAFAVGVLTLLGRSISPNVRVFLLALAIIDDIIAVLIIAVFYAGGLDYHGFLVAGLGLLAVLSLQHIGISAASAYVLPGLVTWFGVLMTGVHPTLAGVVLGMMTPVVPLNRHAARTGGDTIQSPRCEPQPPVVWVQIRLHPWVAYGIMPLFALANAGVSFGAADLSTLDLQWIIGGVALALVVGKPLGIIGTSGLMVWLGYCRLPPGVSWGDIVLIGLLAGIGFTMSIFITMLAFNDEALVGAAKLGVLLGSLSAAVLGLSWGVVYRRIRQTAG